MTEHAHETSPGRLGGVSCRVREFQRWNRAMLQHERAFLSKVMAEMAGFLSDEDRDAIMHDFQDIDYFLAAAGDSQLVKTPVYVPDDADSPQVEMWPASEGPVRPSQRLSSAEGGVN